MSRFLLLNFEDFGLNQDITKTIQSQTLACICCLEKSVPFINLSNCRHSDYLDNFSKLDLKPVYQVVCYQCHAVLKNIKRFKNQIEESFKALVSETVSTEHLNTKMLNLEYHKAVDCLIPQGISPLLDIDDVKAEFEIDKEVNDTEFNLDDINIDHTNKRLVNIQTGLQIINRNTVDLQMITKGIDSLKEITLNSLRTEVSSLNECTPNNFENSSSLNKCYIEFELDGEECPEETITVPVKTKNQLQKESNQTVCPVNIKTVKLTKDELLIERSSKATSRNYLKQAYKCQNCLIGFEYKENLEDHNKRKHWPKIGSVTCEICLQVLFPPGCYNAHIFRHYTRYECMQCCKRFNLYHEALTHHRKHHPVNNLKYKCQFCSYSTDLAKKLKYHCSKIHQKYVCIKCGVVLNDNKSLKKHPCSRNNKRKLIEIEVANEKEAMDISQIPELGSACPSKLLVCDHCQRVIKNRARLITHLKTHERT